MMKLLKFLGFTAATFTLLTSSALAADIHSPFVDIPPGSPYEESVTYLFEQGVTSGTGENQYSPQRPISIQEWAVLLSRALGEDDLTGIPPETQSSACIQQCYHRGWLDITAVSAPDTPVCRGELLRSAFRAFGIPVYDASLYSDDTHQTAWENAVRVGQELGLCPNGSDPQHIMTRGDAALLLFALMNQSFEVAPPPLLEELSIHASTDVDLNDYLLEIDQIPAPILDAFDDTGWEYHIDSAYLQDYSAEHDLSCIGLTYYSTKRIYVGPASPTLHEFGHFLDWALGFPPVQEQLYQAEAQQSVRVLRDYSATNSHEYFADFFAYWIRNSGRAKQMELLKEAAPETYAYFAELEAQGWVPETAAHL